MNSDGRLSWAISGLALLVIAVCGLVWVVVPQRARPAPSNWALATALPPSGDFPADWQYALRGSLAPWANITPNLDTDHDQGFTPAQCASSPMDDAGPAGIAELAGVQAHPPGQGGQSGQFVHYWIWRVADPAELVSQYLDWLQGCGSYQFSYRDPQTGASGQTTVVTSRIDTPTPEGVDAVAATTIGADTSAGPTHLYYALRGVLVECWFSVRGDELKLAQRLADQTVAKLVAL